MLFHQVPVCQCGENRPVQATCMTMPVTTVKVINHSLLGNYTIYSGVFHTNAHLTMVIVMKNVFSVYFGVIPKPF